MNRTAALALALALGLGALTLAGCSDNQTNPPPPVPYRSIVIAAAFDTIPVGGSLRLTAAVTDTAGQPVPVPQLSWHSSAPAIASVDGSGRVTGQSEGRAVITASGGGAVSNPETLTVVQGLGWVNQSSAAQTVSNLNGVHFVDALHGWAVGDLGVILATTDGGLDWARQPAPTLDALRGVFFPTAAHGFAVGGVGRVLETTDAGDNWNIRTGITSLVPLRDVFFLGPDLGFIVGDNGFLARTDDGGDTWSTVPSGATSFVLRSVWVTNQPGPDTLAWAVGDGGIVIGSRDAGRTWSVFEPAVTTQDLRGVVRRSNTEAFAAGNLGTVATTVASGDTAVWVLGVSPGAFFALTDVAWPAGDHLYVVGANVSSGVAAILFSADGGQTWTSQPLPAEAPISSNEIRSVWFVDANRGWAVGKEGLILHTATGGGP